MKVTVEELPQSRKQIQIELEEEEINKHFDSSLSQYAKAAQVPGFRKGKVPRPVLEMKFGKSLQAEVLDKIVDESYEKIRKEEKIEPVSPASIDTKDVMPEKNKPYTFRITVDVRPEIRIDEYKGLVLEREKIEVAEKDVNAVLKRKQEERAEFLPVADRPVVKGDWVLLDGDILLDGKVVQDLSGQMVEVGLDNLPKEVSEALIGSSVGDEKKLSSKTENGEEITYRFRVKAIKERRLLIVNDEFARDLGGFQSLDELKADIRKELSAIVDMRVKEDLKKQIIDKLVGKVEVEFPSALIERQVERIKVLSKVRRDGSVEKLSEKELGELAVRRLKEYFVLDEIAKRENITVTDEELEKVKAKISEGRKDAEIDMENVRSNLMHGKVFDFLLSTAGIRDKEERLIVKPGDVNFIRRGEDGLE